MNIYFLHESIDKNKAQLYHYLGEVFQSKSDLDLNDIHNLIKPDGEIFYFIPSSKVTSFPIDSNNLSSEENLKAEILSNIDTYIVSDISENEIFIHRDADLNIAFLVDKDYLNSIYEALRETGAKIKVYPEHLLLHAYSKSSIFEILDRTVFSFISGEGFSQTTNNLISYISILKKEQAEYKPSLLTNNETLNKHFHDCGLDEVTLDLLHTNFVKNHQNLPNLFKQGFSLKYWLKRFQISKVDYVIACAFFMTILIYPIATTSLNNTYSENYKNGTINLFKGINPNIKKVVNPRRQIDEIINSYNLEKASELSIQGIESLKRLDIPQITKVNIDVKKSEASLRLAELGVNQYNLLKNLMPQANINLIDEDIQTSDGKISGSIIIGFGGTK